MINFTFLSSIDSSDDIESMIGKKYHKKIEQLKQLRSQGSITGIFEYKMGGSKQVKYNWQKPFLPFLYVSGIGARIVCSPLRTWIDPICNQCVSSDVEESTADVNEIVEDFKSKFGDGNIPRQAIKIKLIQQGVNAFSPRIVQAVKYIERMQQEKLVSVEALASELELKPTKTLLFPDKQPEVST